jgi:hypothetical protein
MRADRLGMLQAVQQQHAEDSAHCVSRQGVKKAHRGALSWTLFARALAAT